MTKGSRIPEISDLSFDGALAWFSQMHCEGLLFHPEDDPADIVRLADGERAFSASEVRELRSKIRRIEAAIGHDAMVAAAYPIFMNAFGLQLDA